METICQYLLIALNWKLQEFAFNPLSVNDEYTRIAVTFEIRYWRVYSQKNIMKCGQLYHLAGNLHIVATLTKSLLKYF